MVEKRKRGRPHIYYIDLQVKNVKSLFPELTTKMGRQNRAYMMHACAVLFDMEKYGEIEDFGIFGNRKKGTLSLTLLTEIGRLKSLIFIKDMLKTILEEQKKEKRTAMYWVKTVRETRKIIYADLKCRGVYYLLNNAMLEEINL